MRLLSLLPLCVACQPTQVKVGSLSDDEPGFTADPFEGTEYNEEGSDESSEDPSESDPQQGENGNTPDDEPNTCP